jgi:hypothetical protein
MAEETKSVTVQLPASVAAAVEAAAAQSERSLAGEIRVAVKAHLETVEAEATTTSSGFSKEDAEALGVKFVTESARGVYADYRADGATMHFGGPGVSLAKALTQIEDWASTRKSMGIGSPAPVPIVETSKTAGPSGPVKA